MRRFATSGPALIALAFLGAGQMTENPVKEEFRRLVGLPAKAKEPAAGPLQNELETRTAALLEARKFFLHAALLVPGNVGCAREITGLTGGIRVLVEKIAERDRMQEDLSETIAPLLDRLRALAKEQEKLGAQAGAVAR